MPYGTRKRGDKYQTINTKTGRVFGTHPTKEKAMAQVKALYANVPDAKKEEIEKPIKNINLSEMAKKIMKEQTDVEWQAN